MVECMVQASGHCSAKRKHLPGMQSRSYRSFRGNQPLLLQVCHHHPYSLPAPPLPVGIAGGRRPQVVLLRVALHLQHRLRRLHKCAAHCRLLAGGRWGLPWGHPDSGLSCLNGWLKGR